MFKDFKAAQGCLVTAIDLIVCPTFPPFIHPPKLSNIQTLEEVKKEGGGVLSSGLRSLF